MRNIDISINNLSNGVNDQFIPFLKCNVDIVLNIETAMDEDENKWYEMIGRELINQIEIYKKLENLV